MVTCSTRRLTIPVAVLVVSGCGAGVTSEAREARDQFQSLAVTLCTSPRAVLADAARFTAQDTVPDPFALPRTQEQSRASAWGDSLQQDGYLLDSPAMLQALSLEEPLPSFVEAEIQAVPISASAPLIAAIRILYGPFLPSPSLPFTQRHPGEELVLHLEIIALWRDGIWDRRNLLYSTLFLNRNSDLWQAASARKGRFSCSSLGQL